MKPFTRSNYKLEELKELRGWNYKTIKVPGLTKERIIFYPLGRIKEWYGSFMREFHVKPIHYVGLDGMWHDLDEVTWYYGNKKGMILKPGWEEKIDRRYLHWYMKRQENMKGRGVIMSVPSTYFGMPIGQVRLPVLMNDTTGDLFPDAHPETSTVDGGTFDDPGSATWAATRDAVGDGFEDDITGGSYPRTRQTAGAYTIHRNHDLFDTSSIGATDTKDSGTFEKKSTDNPDNDNDAQGYLAVTQCLTASDTALAAGDYDGFTGFTGAATKGSDDIDLTGMSTSAYIVFTLDSTGLGWIARSGESQPAGGTAGISYLGVLEGHDIEDIPIADGTFNGWNADLTAEETGTTSDPRLNITFTVAGIASLRQLIGHGQGTRT